MLNSQELRLINGNDPLGKSARFLKVFDVYGLTTACQGMTGSGDFSLKCGGFRVLGFVVSSGKNRAPLRKHFKAGF